MSAVENARAVRDRYAERLAVVQAQIAEDAALDPKAAPDKTLTEVRWKLAGKLRIAEELVQLFDEAGI